MRILYVTDLDGTFLRDDKKISRYSADSINRMIKKGLLFTAATARTASSVVPMFQGIDLSLPVILLNGVCVYDIRENKYLKAEKIKRDKAEEILRAVEGQGLSAFLYCFEEDGICVYYQTLQNPFQESFYQARKDGAYKRFVQIFDLWEKIKWEEVIYFAVLGSREETERLYQEILKIGGISAAFYKDHYTNSGEVWYLEIFSERGSKENALPLLKEYSGADEVVCFGDNMNDLGMLRAADRGYAVRNAAQEVKKAADAVIGRNEEDGVARFIESEFYAE